MYVVSVVPHYGADKRRGRQRRGRFRCRDRRKWRESARAIRERARVRALMLLGGCCERCGNSDSRVLQIDHRIAHRQQVTRPRPEEIARDVLRHPSKYQALCANCNWIKRWENNENKQRIA